MATYTFGDDAGAVERLALVASVYEPTSRAFLLEQAAHHPGLALDLGCGPGFSTELLSSVCGPKTLIGIDASAEFLDVARQRLPSAMFLTLDVTSSPLARAAADLIYARLVLAHLPDPMATAAQWREMLAPGGALLIEDLEEIHAPPGPLTQYDEVSAEMVRGGGGLMYAGRALGALGGELVPVTVSAALAARIYLFNLERWIKEARAGTDRLVPLRAELQALISDDPVATVSWIVRQIVVRP